jgi:DNA-binding IclR family transcriptional regulator
MRSAAEPREIKVKTVERTLMLLEILAEHNSLLSLTRLSQLSKLSVSTTYRLLNTLCRSGFVERDKLTGHYKLGLKAFLIGNAALQSVELRSTALPYLSHLAQECGESVYLSILSNQNIVYSDCAKTAGPIQIGIQTGVPVPACQTSSGRVLMAFLTPPEQQKFIDQFTAGQLIANPRQFAEELQQVRTAGYSAGISDFSGTVREISVPIFNYLKSCVGALSIFRPVFGDQLSPQELALLAKVQAASHEISRAMGYSYPNEK